VVGEPADIEVAAFEWTVENVVHIASHYVSPLDVEAVRSSSPLFFVNLPGRSASHVMIGRDGRGRALYVPIVCVSVPDIWLVVSARESRFARRLYRAGEEQGS
jgi:hypothetical protein